MDSGSRGFRRPSRWRRIAAFPDRAAAAGCGLLPASSRALRLGALAVHPQFAFADHALNMAERQPGNRASRKRSTRMPFSSGRHRDGLHLAQGQSSNFLRLGFRLRFGLRKRLRSRLRGVLGRPAWAPAWAPACAHGCVGGPALRGRWLAASCADRGARFRGLGREQEGFSSSRHSTNRHSACS